MLKKNRADVFGGQCLYSNSESSSLGATWYAAFIVYGKPKSSQRYPLFPLTPNVLYLQSDPRSIHQDEDAKSLPFLLETPTRNTLLPETPPMTPPPTGQDGNGNGFPISPPPSTRHLSTSVLVGTEKFGGFQLSAKTATLFHRAIRIDKKRGEQPGNMPLVAEYADLDGEIRKTTLTLLNETLDWESTLDCFAMLVR